MGLLAFVHQFFGLAEPEPLAVPELHRPYLSGMTVGEARETLRKIYQSDASLHTEAWQLIMDVLALENIMITEEVDDSDGTALPVYQVIRSELCATDATYAPGNPWYECFHVLYTALLERDMNTYHSLMALQNSFHERYQEFQ